MRWFVLGQSAEVIAQEARLERKRVLRALEMLPLSPEVERFLRELNDGDEEG